MVLSRTAVASLTFLAATLVFGVVLGFVLALGSSEPDPWEKRWAELGVEEAEFVFLGDFTQAEQESIRREMKAAQVVFAEHFGAVTSDFMVIVSDDLESLNKRLAGIRPDTQIWFRCGGIEFAGGILLILEDCPERTHARGGPLAHEYFHVLQRREGGLASERQVGTARNDAWLEWLEEGSAVYASVLFNDAQSRRTVAVSRRVAQLLWSSLGEPLPSTGAGLDRPEYEVYVYRVGFLATDWLVKRAGPESVLKFFRLGGHEAAFEAAFGLSLGHFRDRFEDYRLDVAPPFEWRAGGTVLGIDGAPVEGMEVYALVRIGSEGWTAGIGKTDTRGNFEFAAPGSGYTIALVLQCPREDDVLAWLDAGESGGDGFVADEDGIWDVRDEGQGPSRAGSATARTS